MDNSTPTRVKNTDEMKEYRRELRNNSTVAEKSLWKSLKGRQVEGLLFRRQYSIEHYILDFYCPELKLAIELDGEVHKQQSTYDEERSRHLLERYGIKVLRFENKCVYEQLRWILAAIKSEKERQQKEKKLSP